MRLNDRRDGSIKVLLVLVLLFANIALPLPNDQAPAPGSAGFQPAVRGILPRTVERRPPTPYIPIFINASSRCVRQDAERRKLEAHATL